MSRPLLPWTQADVDAGLCTADDLKNQTQTHDVVLDPIDPTLPFEEKVRKGLEKHLDRVGYESVWKDSPDAVLKAIVKVIQPEPRPPVQIANVFGNVNPFPWVTAERLKASRSIELAEDIKAKSLPPPDETKH